MSQNLLTALSQNLLTALSQNLPRRLINSRRLSGSAKTQITISLLVLVFTGGAQAEPALYRAIYKADFKGSPVSAKGIRQLSRDENGTYTLSSTAKSFFATVTESTAFSLQDEQVVPVQYKYRRSGLGKNRNTVLTFDWDNMKVLNDVQSDPWEMDIKEGTTDKLLYQMKMQQDLVSAHSKGQPWPVLEYQVADSGRLKQYHFEVIDEEVIDTPVGKINTIKVSRINDRKNRTTTFWLALDYGFILVRFQQKTDKGKGFELLLKEAEFDGKQI